MDEYVSREAAIEAAKHAWAKGLKPSQYIEALPVADVAPVVHWVPVNEDLPPDGQHVLCWYEYFRYGEYNRMYQTFGMGYQFHGIWGGEVARGSKTRVLAWMPLPNPPEMDGGSDHAVN